MTTPHTIAVLGLGRMGDALATRLVAQDWDVVGWTRSGRTSGAVKTTGDPNDAVAQADLVLLALFDGPACQQVLDDVRDSLRTDTIVLNTSTIAPAEASKLARQLGPSYIHAPVLGSVPAAAVGALQILAAADQDTLDRARPALETLGTVRRVDDASTAAALKLIANNSLAGAVLALRDSLRQADALGLPRAQVLDVLELGQLGGLVTRKRPFLAGRPAAVTAEFTIGALAKDMALLAAASNTPCAAQPTWPTPLPPLRPTSPLPPRPPPWRTPCSNRSAPTSADTPPATPPTSATRSCPPPTSRESGTAHSSRGPWTSTALSSTAGRLRTNRPAPAASTLSTSTAPSRPRP